jgi:hypothetical protein
MDSQSGGQVFGYGFGEDGEKGEHGLTASEFNLACLGHSIREVRAISDTLVFFELTGDARLRVAASDLGLDLTLLSTTPLDEIPPIVLRLAADGQFIPIGELTTRLEALEALHAAVMMLTTSGKEELQTTAKYVSNYADLLPDEDRLWIEATSPGSWCVTLLARTRQSLVALLAVISVAYSRGREALLAKLEAESRLKELQANQEAVKLLTGLFDLHSRMKADPHAAGTVDAELRQAMIDNVALLRRPSGGRVRGMNANRSRATHDLYVPPPSTHEDTSSADRLIMIAAALAAGKLSG